MIQIPDEYKTGNPGMDAKIARQLEKEQSPKISTNEKIKIDFINQLDKSYERKNKSKFRVSAKEYRTYLDGTLFASKGEMERWDYLLKLQKNGEIADLEKQVEFLLIEGIENEQYGTLSPIIYIADYVYTNVSYRKEYKGRKCVEDFKGSKLAVSDKYKIKRRMFLYRYGKDYLFFEVYPDK